MSDPAPRFERACAELAQALGNFLAAIGAELRRIDSTVAPHSHPAAEVSAPPPVTDQPARMSRAPHGAPVGDSVDVSSLQTSPAEASPPPAAFSGGARWTAERLELLRETYTTGVPLDDIVVQLNALPAKVMVFRKYVAPMAASKGWKRPTKPAEKTAEKLAECWTTKRLATAQSLYESGAPMIEIISEVNALPGPAVNAQRITLWAGARGWKRPVVVKLATVDPIPANAAQIIQWAGDRGMIVRGRDLPVEAINAKRHQLGLAPFKLVPATRGAIL
jgi:hypothetical protein